MAPLRCGSSPSLRSAEVAATAGQRRVGGPQQGSMANCMVNCRRILHLLSVLRSGASHVGCGAAPH
eukprot:41860-Chlamydomonas_euryale.AAC.1